LHLLYESAVNKFILGNFLRINKYGV